MNLQDRIWLARFNLRERLDGHISFRRWIRAALCCLALAVLSLGGA